MAYTYAIDYDDGVEIRIDLEQPGSSVQYRFGDDDEWISTPFQCVEFNCRSVPGEMLALDRVIIWLEGIILGED